METVSITLSNRARDTAFAVCNNRKYSNAQLLIGASIVNKLREGSSSEEISVRDQNNQLVEATIYKNFPDNIEVIITFEEKEILVGSLKNITEWHPSEAKTLLELQEKLQVKLI